MFDLGLSLLFISHGFDTGLSIVYNTVFDTGLSLGIQYSLSCDVTPTLIGDRKIKIKWKRVFGLIQKTICTSSNCYNDTYCMVQH